MDAILFTISLFFSLIGLLLEEVASISSPVISVLRYFPILIIYIRHLKVDFASLIPILFAAFMFLLSAGGGHYSVPKILVAMMLPFFLFVYTKITFSQRQITLIVSMFLFAYVLYAFICLSNHFSINSNQLSFRILILTVNLFFCIYTRGGTSRSILSPGLLILLILSLFLILHTKSRNSLLVYLLLVISFIVRRRVNQMNIWGLIMLFVLLLYIIYPFVYCLLSDSLRQTSQDTDLMGQDVFSGRQYIWTYIFTQLANPSEFFFGGIDMEWWGKSMHNSALEIVVRFGVPAMVMMELMVYFYFKKVCSSIYKYKSLLLLVIASMVWGWNESGLFLGLAIFTFLPLCILRSRDTNALRHS